MSGIHNYDFWGFGPSALLFALPFSAAPADSVDSAGLSQTLLSSGVFHNFLVIRRSYLIDREVVSTSLDFTTATPLTRSNQSLIDEIIEQFMQLGTTLVGPDVIFVEEHRFQRFE